MIQNLTHSKDIIFFICDTVFVLIFFTNLILPFLAFLQAGSNKMKRKQRACCPSLPDFVTKTGNLKTFGGQSHWLVVAYIGTSYKQ